MICLLSVAAALTLASPAGARSLAMFGMCLAREGTIFYGASWCPQCRAQQEILGGASRYVRYVECSVDGGRDTTEECRDADVSKYPTWVFPDGSRQTGRVSIETLAARSGCPLDDEGEEDSAD
jgi:large repetitive protein